MAELELRLVQDTPVSREHALTTTEYCLPVSVLQRILAEIRHDEAGDVPGMPH